MARLRLISHFLALLATATSGCLVFNESCPVSRPEVWGQLNVQLDIRRETVRRCEAAAGNLIADAMLNYHYGLRDQDGEVAPKVALINAGAIRDEISCGAAGEKREYLKAGPITDLDIFQLLPFNNTVVVVEMSGRRLKNVLEWGVSALGQEGKAGERGYFLQLAAENGIKITVDCSQPAQTLSADRKQITAYGSRISSVTIAGQPLIEDAIYRVATLDYLLGTDESGVANDGFVAFRDEATTPPIKEYPTHLPLTDVLRIWLSTPFAPDYPAVEGRIEQLNCNYQCPR
jgi:5'-nucleotidase/UDP-sugar diphosphatase